MSRQLLQAKIDKRGLVLDPRTKMLLLLTMSTFVLGGADGEKLAWLMPAFCAVPALALITARQYRMATLYVVIYSVTLVCMEYAIGVTNGLVRFLVFGSGVIITRFMPCIMMGAYLFSSTTVSEFTAAMHRMHVPEAIIIPLSVMFRFFPTVYDEACSINAAMRMRDIQCGGANVSKMLEYRLVPLMACCAKIGEELSAAALTRGLGGEIRRTNVCEIGFHVQDIVVIAMCAVPYVLWCVS